ncbi:MAG: HIRAN domain-containing protein [Firmicutes bacterium]|nr:HIRAN domain-containing protein [Bacillota bacterium]
MKFVEPGMKVKLEKEPDNKFDKEAIIVKMEGLGKIGYVANSVNTVVGESYSAGRLYDKIKKQGTGTVKYNMGAAILCELDT